LLNELGKGTRYCHRVRQLTPYGPRSPGAHRETDQDQPKRHRCGNR
jgi:hypothetical protein